MAFNKVQDDQRVFVTRRDLSGGVNTRQNASLIAENQASALNDIDITIPGETKKRLGETLLRALGTAGTGSLGFMPRGGTNEILVTYGQKLSGCTNPTENGSATFTEHKTDFTNNLPTSLIKVTCSGANGDVVLVSNGTDNVFQMLQNHTFVDLVDDNTAPPKTTVMTFYRNRAWFLKSNLLYWSEALPSTYLAQFDRTSNNYNLTVGVERALIGLRDVGLIALGSDAVYGINPSIAPAATDKPEKILDIGCVAGNTAIQVADDVLFLAPDGVRGVFRTQQDKLQLGQSYPLSYVLQDEFDNLSWANISKACAIWFQNKYLLAVPTGTSTYNNQVWCYYPGSNSWVVIKNWNVGSWIKIQISGEEKLYYIDGNNGSVYRAFSGYTDNTTAIVYQEIGRNEDLGNPYRKKQGGEVIVKAEISGVYDINVYASVDNSGYTFLGALDLSGSLITFPVTFPVAFPEQDEAIGKFHLDDLGEWYLIKLKLEQTTANTSDIKVLERTIVSFLTEYQPEE